MSGMPSGPTVGGGNKDLNGAILVSKSLRFSLYTIETISNKFSHLFFHSKDDF